MSSAEPPVVHLRLPPALLALFPAAERYLEIEAASVGALVAALDARWPGMGDCLADARPALRRHINVFVDGERAGLATPLSAGADVFILLAISGG